MIKESWNLTGSNSHLATLNKSSSLKYYLLLMIISMQKIKDTNWLFPFFLLIKQVFNFIEWETQQATLNQKVVVSGATFP